MPIDLRARKKPRGRKYKYLFNLYKLVEVNLEGPEEFQLYVQVVFPDNYRNSRSLQPTEALEYEVNLPKFMETIYSIGDTVHELVGPSLKDKFWKLFGLKQEETKKHKSGYEQRLDLSKIELNKLISDEIVGVSEVANILDVSIRRVQKLAKDGRIGICVEGRYVFSRTDLLREKEVLEARKNT